MNEPLVPTDTKCPVCNKIFKQPVRKHGGGKRKIYCSPECCKLDWARGNGAKRKASILKFDQSTKGRIGQRKYNLKKKYDITAKDFDNMFTRQNGKCLGCQKTITRNVVKNENNHACVDHNHETGKVRGLLCDSCNRGLGYLKEDKATLRRLMAYLSYDRKQKHVYIIGALKNEQIPIIAKELTNEGYKVFSDWHNPGPEADMHWQKHEEFKGTSYKEALNGPHVETVFYYDMAYLDLCDIAILVLPAGKSGHLELGYVAGKGKKTFILLDKEPDRYDIMTKFATGVCNNLEELKEELKKIDILT